MGSTICRHLVNPYNSISGCFKAEITCSAVLAAWEGTTKISVERARVRDCLHDEITGTGTLPDSFGSWAATALIQTGLDNWPMAYK